MLEILCFDFCAVIILLILLFTLLFHKSISDRASKRLLGLVITTILAAIFDMAASYFNGVSGFRRFNYISSGFYYTLRNVSYYLYASYIIAISRIWHQVENKTVKTVRFIPIAIIAIICITASKTHIFYYYNESATYIRGDWLPLIYVWSAIYIVYAFYYIVKSIPIIGYRKSASLASCAFLSIVTSVVQFKFPYLVMDILGFAISLLCITLFIDNPEEKMDSTALLMRRQTYINDINTSFFTSRPFDIVHISIKNIREIEQMMSFSLYTGFVRTIGSKLKYLNAQKNCFGELYYLRDGAFRIVLDGNDYERSYKLSKEICEALNGELNIHDMDIHVDTAISVTQCPQDFDNADNLFGFTKAALYLEKVGEVISTKEMLLDETSNIRSNIDKYVERGIIGGGFKVFYHPIYSVKEHKYNKLEATLRLLDKQKGVIAPELFIPIAEQNGAIIELGTFVLEEVCNFISSEEFKRTGVEQVSINLSIVQCLQSNMADQMIETIKKYGISPDKIMVEITESLASDNNKAFDDNIRKLTEFGVDIALDNYGAGYSNITTLSKMPIKTIKFDKSFTESDSNSKLKLILDNTVEMIKSLGKEIIICGVNDSETSDHFISLGFDGIQGEFNNIRPMPENMLCVFYDSLNDLN